MQKTKNSLQLRAREVSEPRSRKKPYEDKACLCIHRTSTAGLEVLSASPCLWRHWRSLKKWLRREWSIDNRPRHRQIPQMGMETPFGEINRLSHPVDNLLILHLQCSKQVSEHRTSRLTLTDDLFLTENRVGVRLAREQFILRWNKFLQSSRGGVMDQEVPQMWKKGVCPW